VYTRARMLPPSKILGTTLNKAIVADGCMVLADKIERSVIGGRSRIGRGSIGRATYMLDADDYAELGQVVELTNTTQRHRIGVGERCYIEHAILDRDCRIGNDVRIVGGKHLPNGDFEHYTVQDGVIVIKKNAVIANGTSIGR